MASSSSTLPPSSEQVEVKEEVEEKYEKKGKKEKKEKKEKGLYRSVPYRVLSDFDEEELHQLRRARAFGVEAEARYTRARLAKQENEENEKEKEKEKEKEGDGFGVEEVKEIEPTEPPEGSLPPGRVDQGEHPEIYERMKPAKGPFLPGRINWYIYIYIAIYVYWAVCTCKEAQWKCETIIFKYAKYSHLHLHLKVIQFRNVLSSNWLIYWEFAFLHVKNNTNSDICQLGKAFGFHSFT